MLLFFFRICGPTIHLEKGVNRLVSKTTSWSVVGFCLGFFFSPLFHYGKHQCCIHVSPVCFSNVCSNRRSTSSLAFVALAAFKNKCPVTFRRGRRSSNLFLPPTDERARPNGRAQILRKDRRNGKAPVQSVCLWWQSQVHYFTGRYSHMICV